MGLIGLRVSEEARWLEWGSGGSEVRSRWAAVGARHRMKGLLSPGVCKQQSGVN